MTTGEKTDDYTSLDDALEAATDGAIVTLKNDTTVTKPHNLWKAITLDLGGKTVTILQGSSLIVWSQLIIQDGSADRTGTMACNSSGTSILNVQQGEMTIKGGIFNGKIMGVHNRITIEDGVFNGEVNLYDSMDSISISGGKFYHIWYPGTSVLNLLADGCGFYHTQKNTLVKAAEVTDKHLYDVYIGTHKHTWNGSVCTECGHICTHPAWENGVCKRCGYVCTHDTVTETNGGYACAACGTVMVASIGATYYTDLYTALTTATDGQTVKLLADAVLTEPTTESTLICHKITLDMNGKTIAGKDGFVCIGIQAYTGSTGNQIGNLTVNGPGEIRVKILIHTQVALTAKGSVNFTEISGGSENSKLDLSQWSGQIQELNVSGANTSIGGGHVLSLVLSSDYHFVHLSGGTYDKISTLWGNTFVKAGSLLIAGYAFRRGDDSYVRYADDACGVENVSVLPCAHLGKAEEFSDSNQCPYCDTTLAATVTKEEMDMATMTKVVKSKGFTKLDEGVLTLAEGGTLKLLADAGTVTIEKPCTLDLSGHNISELTVKAKVTIQDSAETKGVISQLTISDIDLTLGDLLEEGYGFRYSNGNWEYDWRTAAASVTVQETPITWVKLKAERVEWNENAEDQEVSTTIVYGSTGSVKLPPMCAQPGWATQATCTLYELEGGTMKTLSDSAASYTLPDDLPVGEHTYRATFRSGDYEKSAEITITVVEKAEQAPLTVTGDTTVTYGETLTLSTTGGSGNGAVTYRVDETASAGEADIDANTGVLQSRSAPCALLRPRRRIRTTRRPSAFPL